MLANIAAPSSRCRRPTLLLPERASRLTRTILGPYELREAGGARIAFIGLTFEGTPTVVTPSGVAGLEFRPEVATVDALVRKLRRERGVDAFVVLLHQGGTQVPPAPPASPATTPAGDEYTDVNRCVNFNGPEIQSIAQGLDPRVSVIVSAHTHQPYICRFSAKLVTSAASFGRVVTDIDLTIDRRSDEVRATSARNEIVTQDVPADPAAQAILDKYASTAATTTRSSARAGSRWAATSTSTRSPAT